MIAWNLDAHVMGTSARTPLCGPVPVLNPRLFSGGYEFLMQNCKITLFSIPRPSMLTPPLSRFPFSGVRPFVDEAGDKICLFGFSRGAYTARALAGMLHKVGLLPAHNHQQIPFAYTMYTRTDDQGWEQSTAFKKAFSIDVDIDFIGVW